MIPEYSEFKNKTVVITGGGGVLGSQMARVFAAQRANVVLLNRTLSKAVQIAEEITSLGGSALAVEGNVLSMKSLENARAQINEVFGTCDILVNNAGGNHPGGTTGTEFYEKDRKDLSTFFDLDEEGIRYVFDLNFMGTLLPTRVFAADMIGKQGCSVVNISSMSAYRPLTKIPAYSGAKAAVSSFTQWLAVHLARTGIRVNALAPGFFLTTQNHKLLMKNSDELTNRGESIIAHTPMGRFGKPEDLDGALLWLCSDSAGFVTGIILPVDGGFNAYSGV